MKEKLIISCLCGIIIIFCLLNAGTGPEGQRKRSGYEDKSRIIENSYVVIYTSVLQDEKTRDFEKKFTKVVEDYSLSNKILYLDLTEQYNNKKLYNSIVDKYELLNMPCIIIFKDGTLHDIYSISDRNYDVNLLVSYLKIKGVIYD